LCACYFLGEDGGLIFIKRVLFSVFRGKSMALQL